MRKGPGSDSNRLHCFYILFTEWYLICTLRGIEWVIVVYYPVWLASRSRRGRDCMWLDLQIPIQIVPITTKVVSSHYTLYWGRGWPKSYVVRLPNNSYKPITNTAWVGARLCKLQKRCTRLAAASDKVYQLLAHGRRFSPGTPASSTTKTGRHDIAEILLKVTLNT
jgi:hypothetical protein